MGERSRRAAGPEGAASVGRPAAATGRGLRARPGFSTGGANSAPFGLKQGALAGDGRETAAGFDLVPTRYDTAAVQARGSVDPLGCILARED